MDRSSREILDALLEVDHRYRTSDGDGTAKVGKELGILIRDFRKSLRLSPNEFARRLGVSVQSVHRWEIKKPPRTDQLAKFGDLLVAPSTGQSTSGALEAPSPLIEPRRVTGFREMEEILEAERASKQVFLLKSQTPFFSGYQAMARQTMLDILQSQYDRRKDTAKQAGRSKEEPFFYFFVPKPPEIKEEKAGAAKKENGVSGPPKGTEAYLSVVRFLWELQDHKYDLIRHLVVAYQLDDTDLSEMGIGRSHISWIVTNYDDAGRHSRGGRPIDFFLEVPAAVYRDKERRTLIEYQLDSVWIEYPVPYVLQLRESWDKALVRIQKDKKKKIDVKTLPGWAKPYEGQSPIFS